MPWTRSQIDKLGDRLKNASIDDGLLRALSDFRNEFIEPTTAVRDFLLADDRVSKMLLSVTTRLAKSKESIVAKLRREHARLSQIQDIGGIRLIVGNLRAQERVSHAVLHRFDGARLIDRRAAPRFGYRAVHIVVRERSFCVEIQIRTLLQHNWAQMSERLSDTVDPAIKYGGGPKPIQDALLFWSEDLARVDARSIDDGERDLDLALDDAVFLELQQSSRAFQERLSNVLRPIQPEDDHASPHRL